MEMDDRKKQIDDVHELISKYHESWKHGSGDWKRGLAESIVDEGYRKQRKGEWIYHECVASYEGAISGYSCSFCGSFVDEEVYEHTSFPNQFCGNCGARMKGGEGDAN